MKSHDLSCLEIKLSQHSLIRDLYYGIIRFRIHTKYLHPDLLSNRRYLNVRDQARLTNLDYLKKNENRSCNS